MSDDSAAKRFYERSHRINSERSVIVVPTVEAGLREIRAPGNRYHCVYTQLAISKMERVVELGYGGPSLIPALASLSGSYTLVDIVDRSLALTYPENVTFVEADLNNDFPFEDKSFDAVLAMMVVEHLFDPFHSFKELARICADDGIIIVNLPNIGSIKCRLSLLFGQMPVTSSKDWFEKREWDGNHLHYFTVADTIRLANISGLRLKSLNCVGSALKLKNFAPSFFCNEISYVFDKNT